MLSDSSSRLHGKEPKMHLFGRRPPLSADAEQRLTDRLRSHVDILAGLIGPRHLGKPKALEAAATYIERQFSEIGDTVVRQPYAVDGAEVANLIVERRGSSLADQVVVVGAHYDTIPTTPGADDNASAVAMLIEVALARRQSDAANRAIRRFSMRGNALFPLGNDGKSAVCPKLPQQSRSDYRHDLSGDGRLLFDVAGQPADSAVDPAMVAVGISPPR